MSDYFDEMSRTPLSDGEVPNIAAHMQQYLRDAGMWELLWSDGKLPPPASKDAVKNLLEIKIDPAEKKKCPVCLKEFQVNDKARQMPCQHVFHQECLVPWFQKTNSCPLCRYELPTDDEDYEMYKKEKQRAVERDMYLESLHDVMFS